MPDARRLSLGTKAKLTTGRTTVVDAGPMEAATMHCARSGTSFATLSVLRGLVLYRDTNGNHRLELGVDETVYRGDGSVTSCLQTVTVSPKEGRLQSVHRSGVLHCVAWPTSTSDSSTDSVPNRS